MLFKRFRPFHERFRQLVNFLRPENGHKTFQNHVPDTVTARSLIVEFKNIKYKKNNALSENMLEKGLIL
jgi:hypothetical protein